MDAVWTQDRAVAVSEVHRSLLAVGEIAYNTVKTTMERLCEKGILSRVKAGKAFLYQAALSRDDLERRIVGNAIDQLVEQFPHAVAAFFVQPSDTLSEETLARLNAAIGERRRDGDA